MGNEGAEVGTGPAGAGVQGRTRGYFLGEVTNDAPTSS